MDGGVTDRSARDRLAGAVSRVMDIDRADLFQGGPGSGAWHRKRSTARAVLAYLAVVDLGMTRDAVASWLGYADRTGPGWAIRTLVREHNLPPPHASDAVAAMAAGKAAAVRARELAPAPAVRPKTPTQSASLVAPPPAVERKGSRVAPAAPAATVTLGVHARLGDRVLEELENRRACTAPTLATVLGAKELTIGQTLIQLRHEGRVVADPLGDAGLRGQLWRIAAGGRA